MNPEIHTQMSEPVTTTPSPKTPHPVNQVTTVSKYLALALFIFLPFIGGYIGYVYAPEKLVYHDASITTQLLDSSDVIGTTSVSSSSEMLGKWDELAEQYVEGGVYGEFTLTSYSTTSTDRVEQYNTAHTLVFDGELSVQAEIVTDSMMSPFLMIGEANQSSLPPDFFVENINSYGQVFVDPAIESLVKIMSEAQADQDKKYTIETTITGLIFRKGVPKADSISITKISGEPVIVNIEE